MGGFKDLNFVDRRNAAADAKKAALEKFRANAADPAFAERQKARTASAADRAEAKRVTLWINRRGRDRGQRPSNFFIRAI